MHCLSGFKWFIHHVIYSDSTVGFVRASFLRDSPATGITVGKVACWGKKPVGGFRYRRRGYRRRRAPFWLPLAFLVAGAGALNFWPEFDFDSFRASTVTSLNGRASVVDGDTIEVAGQRVRFNGIDAPESAQQCQDAGNAAYRCGAEAAQALDQFLAQSRPTRCEFIEWDQYGRYVGKCFRADRESVAEWLVANGHAIDWPRHSGGAYAGLQAKARDGQKGIWKGTFQEPWAWRAAHRAHEQSTSTPLFALSSGGECNIKGNISDKGERNYHVPGQAHYDRTRIATGRGERWFCSEQEARKAGWRKARR